MTLVATSQPSAFAIFRKRNFTLLWLARFISHIGSGLTSIAASILVFRITGSALSVGLMLMATALPSLAVGLIAGVFVDRYDRKRIMVAADLLRAVLICVLPLLLPFGIAWLYVIILLSSTLGQFFDPAVESVVPETASDEELGAANALMTVSFTGAEVIGFAAAGLIAARLPIEWAFYLDALTFVASALCIFGLRLLPLVPQEQTSTEAVFQNLRAGVRFIRESPALRSLFLVIVPMGAVFGFHNALLLPFATRALGADEFQYGLIEGLSMIGFVVGALLLSQLADRLHEGQWIATGLLGMALADIVYSQIGSVPVAIMIGIFSAAMNAPLYIARSLLVQRNTPRDMRGRVSSAIFVTRDVVFLVGMAAAGLADIIDVRVLFLAGALVLLFSGLAALVLPGLGQPTAEWRRILTMLRAAPSAPGLGLGRATVLADIDQLAVRLPSIAGMNRKAREALVDHARLYDVAEGTVIVRRGEASDAAYFLLSGRTVASRTHDGGEEVLEVHNAGDFFGEIAALTGVTRTADVIAAQPTTLIQVPAPTLRHILSESHIHRLFVSKMTERMLRMDMVELPRFAGMDQETLRELRTPEPQLLPVE